MASAGHAQAHSSQPTHFSRPSGWRLSWCRPWNRGAVVFCCSGYCSVSRFLNMALKVTPKPATGFMKPGLVSLGSSAIGRLLSVTSSVDRSVTRSIGSATDNQLALAARAAPGHRWQLLSRQWRYGESARHRVEGGGFLGGRFGRFRLLAEDVGGEGQQQEHEDASADVQGDVGEVVVLVPEGPYGRDEHQPDHGDRDEDLPAELHQLVVADARECAAQPDEEEQQQLHLHHEPEHRPPAVVGALP